MQGSLGSHGSLSVDAGKSLVGSHMDPLNLPSCDDRGHDFPDSLLAGSFLGISKANIRDITIA